DDALGVLRQVAAAGKVHLLCIAESITSIDGQQFVPPDVAGPNFLGAGDTVEVPPARRVLREGNWESEVVRADVEHTTAIAHIDPAVHGLVLCGESLQCSLVFLVVSGKQQSLYVDTQ